MVYLLQSPSFKNPFQEGRQTSRSREPHTRCLAVVAKISPDYGVQDKNHRYQSHTWRHRYLYSTALNKECFDGWQRAADVNLLATAASTNTVHWYSGLAGDLRPRCCFLLYLELSGASAWHDCALRCMPVPTAISSESKASTALSVSSCLQKQPPFMSQRSPLQPPR